MLAEIGAINEAREALTANLPAAHLGRMMDGFGLISAPSLVLIVATICAAVVVIMVCDGNPSIIQPPVKFR